jgi:hypothetical protein
MENLDDYVTEVDHESETAAAVSPAPMAHLLSSPRRANPGNRAFATSCLAAPAPFEVPLLAEDRRGNPPHDRQCGELRQTVNTLALEVNEALCAITNYLRGARMLLAANDPASQSKLDKAIDSALAQTSRACSVVRRQRSAAR